MNGQIGKCKKVFNWTDEIIQDMIRLYNEEFWSFTEIGKKYDLNKITVNRKLREFGIKNRTQTESLILKNKRELELKIPQILELLQQGFSVYEIEKMASVCTKLIYQVIVEYKIKPKRKKRSKTIEFNETLIDEMVIRYQDPNENLKTIARYYNVHYLTIREILIQRGVKIKSKKDVISVGTILLDSQILEICDSYQNKGYGIGRLGKMYKVSGKKIKNILTDNNIEIRQGLGDWGTLLSIDEEKEICRIYTNRELGQHAICRKFNIVESKLKDILDKYDIKIISHSESMKLRVEMYKPIKQGREDEKIRQKLDRVREKQYQQIIKEIRIVLLYVRDKISTDKIKKILHTSMETICATLKRYNIRHWEPHEWGAKVRGHTGISGKYHGICFDSLKELSFIINYLEKKGIAYKRGDRIKGLKYCHPESQTIRNYYPDFYTDKYVFEIKPLTMWEYPEVINKAIVGDAYAKENGLKYRLVNFPVLADSIIDKYKVGEIIFTEKQLVRFKRNFGKLLN